MRRRRFRSYALLVFVLIAGLTQVACGLGPVAGPKKPTIVITSPPSGSQFREGEDISILSTATDPTGILRIELAVDGAVVRTDASPNPQSSFALVQVIKVAQGVHTITVRSYNAANQASDPAGISVTILSSGTAPVAPATAPPPPVITPGDTGAPTVAPASPAAPAAPALPTVTPTAGCTNNAAFVQDVTVPDGTQMSAAQAFNKTWRVRNSGSCPWTNAYQFAFVSGEAMATTRAIAVPNTAPGATADLTIPMSAPAGAGAHAGQWRMKAPNGVVFGNGLTVSIVVVPPPTHTPVPVCVGAPIINAFTASPATIAAGASTVLSWGTVDYAQSATIDPDIGGIATPGNIEVKPITTTTYTLYATGCGGTTTRSVTVTVK